MVKIQINAYYIFTVLKHEATKKFHNITMKTKAEEPNQPEDTLLSLIKHNVKLENKIKELEELVVTFNERVKKFEEATKKDKHDN